ncbi:MAG: TolC family protein [Bacteroidota bacterium]|nr:TolC family protein [Bacteroidota bacterium]
MKIKSIITFLMLITGSMVHAQKVTGLNEILQTIDSANPTAKMYAAQIRSLDEAAKGARSWMPTDFGTGLWMTPYNPRLWQKGDNGATGMGQYMLSVQQMFPNKKKQNAEAAYMEGMSASEKERQKFELNQLYAEAKKNYHQWIILKKKMSALNENEKLLNFMIKDAEIRYKNGLDRLSAYYKAKAELGNILNRKVELENEMAQNRIRLNTLMNRNKFEPFDIDTTYTIKDFNSISFDTTTLNNRSDIRAIDKDIQLTYLQQNAERTKVKPEFGIRYDHMFGFGGFPMQYTLMGMAKIPLGKAKRASKANVESLRWKSEALFQKKQILLNEATGMATGMSADVEAKKRQVKLFEENIIPALRKNYQVMQLGYQQNTEQLFTLFDAWDTLNKTQVEYLNQLQQLLTMQVELERILEVK